MVNEIKIAICDDEKIIRKELMRVLQEVLNEEQILYELYEFSFGTDLLKNENDIQLLFLDMDMPEIDGIDVGMKMLELKPKCKIVIASGREDRFKETYKITPLRFISKPFNKEEIREALQAFQRQQIGMTTIEVFKERTSYWIRQKDIQYISAYNGYIEIISNNTLYRKDISLSKVQEMLEKELFVTIHKSYIVNMLWITKENETELFIGNIKLPIGRRHRKKFITTYKNFDVMYR